MVIRTFCINDILKNPEFNRQIYLCNAENSAQDYIKILDSFLRNTERSAVKYFVTPDHEDQSGVELIHLARRIKIPIVEKRLPELVSIEELDGEIIDQLAVSSL